MRPAFWVDMASFHGVGFTVLCKVFGRMQMPWWTLASRSSGGRFEEYHAM